MSEAIGSICERCRRRAGRNEGGMFDYCLHCSKNLCPACIETGRCQDAQNKDKPHRPSEAQEETDALGPL